MNAKYIEEYTMYYWEKNAKEPTGFNRVRLQAEHFSTAVGIAKDVCAKHNLELARICRNPKSIILDE